MSPEGLKIQIAADVSQAIGGLKQVETAMQKNVSANKAVETSVTKSSQAFTTLASSVTNLKSSVASAIPKTQEIGGAFAKLVNLDFSSDFAAALARINANIDKMGVSAKAAIPSVSMLERQVAKFGGGVSSFKAPEYFTKLKPPIDDAGKSLGKIVNPSNQATLALINLGRVAQDAPFGILGIANNLNPLLESFQRLKATTGSTGGALKALGSSLAGAGGLGFALSIASSLAIVFGDRLFGSGKKAKEAADEYKRVQDVLKSVSGTIEERSSVAAASATDEIAKINVLSAVVRDQTKSYNERNNALNQLKTINKGYFGDLTLEQSSLATLTGKVDEYTQALIAAAVVKEFSSDIAKLAVESAKGINAYNSLGKELDQLNKKLEVTQKYIKTEGRQDAINKLNPEYTKLKNRIDDVNDALEKQGSIVADVSKASRVSTEGLSQAIQQSLKFKPLTGEIKAKPTKVSIDEIVKLDKPLRIAATFKIEKLFEEDKKDPREYFDRFKDLKIFDRPIVQPFKIDFSLEKALRDNKVLSDSFKIGIQTAEAFNSGLESTISGGLSSFASGIGEALAGGDVRSAFAEFGNSIGSGLQAIGEQLIAIGVAALLAKEALKKLFSNPAVAIAAGIALTVAGAAFKSVLSKGLSARASGGPVTAGNPYLVGEVGREVFVPSVSGSIIPNNQIGSFSGRTQMATVRVTGRLRGNDMILQNARTNRMQTRLG